MSHLGVESWIAVPHRRAPAACLDVPSAFLMMRCNQAVCLLKHTAEYWAGNYTASSPQLREAPYVGPWGRCLCGVQTFFHVHGKLLMRWSNVSPHCAHRDAEDKSDSGYHQPAILPLSRLSCHFISFIYGGSVLFWTPPFSKLPLLLKAAILHPPLQTEMANSIYPWWLMVWLMYWFYWNHFNCSVLIFIYILISLQQIHT